MITLQELLESRDRRAAHQRELLEKYPCLVLLCLTVQLPGPEKRNSLSMKIADAGVKAVRERFTPAFEEIRDLPTGYEGYFMVEGEPLEIKRASAQIEETHRLGRLMDLDVIGPGGPVSRGEIGLKERPCLICGKPVRYCMRAGTHSREELFEKIEELVLS